MTYKFLDEIKYIMANLSDMENKATQEMEEMNTRQT